MTGRASNSGKVRRSPNGVPRSPGRTGMIEASGRPRSVTTNVDPQMTTGQLLGRLVQEALDRHDPWRPPRGPRRRRSADVAAETSAPKDAARPNGSVAVRRPLYPRAPQLRRRTRPSRTPRRRRRRCRRTPATVTLRRRSGRLRPSGPRLFPTPLRRRRTRPGRTPRRAAGVAASAPKVGDGPQRQAASAAPPTVRPATAGAAPPQPRVRSRAIPAAVRRQVWERDRGCCSYVGPGRWAPLTAPGICWR